MNAKRNSNSCLVKSCQSHRLWSNGIAIASVVMHSTSDKLVSETQATQWLALADTRRRSRHVAAPAVVSY